MKKTYYADTFKAAVSAATVLFSFTIGVCLLTIQRFGSAAIFFLIGLLFLWPILIYGARVSVEQSGIRCFLPWKTLRSFNWDEIAEVGVSGTKIIKTNQSKNTGTLYIYISKAALTDEERFDMMLNWPPKDKIFLTYSRERLDTIQMLFGSKIQTYNAGEIYF